MRCGNHDVCHCECHEDDGLTMHIMACCFTCAACGQPNVTDPEPMEEPMKEVTYEGRFLKMVKENGWEYVERVNSTGVVIIVALTSDHKILFVEQFRPPIHAKCIELPAGLVGDKGKESYEAAVKRELAEESGYEAGQIQYMGNGVVTPGLTSEDGAIYLATGLKKLANPPKDEGENIVLHEIPVNKARAWLEEQRKAGTVIDWKTYVGLFFAFEFAGCIMEA